jgi:hypothetical protein
MCDNVEEEKCEEESFRLTNQKGVADFTLNKVDNKSGALQEEEVAQCELLEDEGWQPAIGVFGAVQTSYGETSRPSQAGQVNLLVSKTILEGDRPLALYGNLGWTELFNPMPEERHGRYSAAIGVAHTLDRDTSFGLSWVRSQQDYRERDENIVAAGISHRLSASGPILGLGAGAGIGQDSPSFLVFASMKWLFGAAAE